LRGWKDGKNIQKKQWRNVMKQVVSICCNAPLNTELLGGKTVVVCSACKKQNPKIKETAAHIHSKRRKA
jgi:hypothetical protein